MKKLIIIVSCILGTFAALYIAGIVYGHYRFYPNTTVNNIDVSMMNAEDADAALEISYDSFEVKLKDGETRTIDLSDISYDVTLERDAERLIGLQDFMRWPESLFRTERFGNSKLNISDRHVVSYDSDKLAEAINKLVEENNETAREPVNAFIDKDGEGHYFIVPQDDGNVLTADPVVQMVAAELDQEGMSADIDGTDAYSRAAVTDQDEELNSHLDHLHALGDEVITIDLTGAQEVLDTETLTGMTYFDEDGTLQVDRDKLDDYVYSLADKYDTYMSKRRFKTTGGQIVEVGGSVVGEYANDTYGFLMDDVNTWNTIYYAILSGETQTVFPTWSVPALTRGQDNSDIGNTYIEVSLSRQKLWYYLNGVLQLETDCVTGMATPKRATPPGVYRIFGKLEDTYLIGEMDGEKWNNHVNYWMSVTWEAIGIHDAPWRNAYGGSIYVNNGSHGCINVPYDMAKYLYYNVAMDTPVIVY